jgi:hypothetical protein
MQSFGAMAHQNQIVTFHLCLPHYLFDLAMGVFDGSPMLFASA